MTRYILGLYLSLSSCCYRSDFFSYCLTMWENIGHHSMSRIYILNTPLGYLPNDCQRVERSSRCAVHILQETSEHARGEKSTQCIVDYIMNMTMWILVVF